MDQTITDLPATENPKKTAKRRARLTIEAIASFDTQPSNDKGSTISYDSPESTWIIYLYDIVARFARKRRGIQVGIVRMVNDSYILMVSWTRGNTIHDASQSVMMDSEAQPVVIDKRLAMNYDRRLGSLSIYHHYIHWSREADH